MGLGLGGVARVRARRVRGTSRSSPAIESRGESRCGATSAPPSGPTGPIGRWASSHRTTGSPGGSARRSQTSRNRPANARPTCCAPTSRSNDAVTIGRAYATARGLYELFVNGERVGDDELTPGFTSYRAHLHVQTFDITSLLRQGDNELRVVLSDGWYRGQVGYTCEHDVYGSEIASLVQVEVDGSPVAATGTGWQSALGSIVRADLIAGQHVDQRVAEEELLWQPAVTVEHDMTSLCASAGSTRPARRNHPPSLGQHVASDGPCGRSRPEHQRLGARRRCRAARHAPHPHARRSARSDRRRHDGPPRTRRLDLRRALGCGSSRRGRLRRCATAIRTAAHDARLPVRAGRGTSGPVDRRRRDRNRRPHRSPPHRLVPLQRRTAEPTRTKPRCGASAPTPATYRPTARNANERAGPATGRSSRPPRHSCTTLPGSPPNGCATWRPTNAPTASSATSRRPRAGGRGRERDQDLHRRIIRVG